MKFNRRIFCLVAAIILCFSLTAECFAAGFNNRYSVVAGGLSHTLAVRDGGSVWAWGNNDSAQLGPVEGNKSQPTEVKGITSAVAVAAGSNFSAALLRGGTVYAWGAGNGTPRQIPGIANVSAISAGQNVLLALKNDGTVWQWTAGSESAPIQVMGLPANIAAISAGGGHYLALTRTGEVWAWGRNDMGQLGLGASDTNDHSTPKKISVLYDIVDIAAGFSHSLAVDFNGNVYAWGSNGYGQLGDGTTINSGKPLRITEISKASRVSAGTDTSMALTATGRIYTWGYGEYGQLGGGSGSAISRKTPEVISLTSAGKPIYIASGLYHNMMVTDNGEVYLWGRNRDGQLGTGQQANGLTPQRGFGIANVNYSIGFYETNGLKTASSWAVDELSTLYNSGLIPPSLWVNFKSNITRAEFAQLIVSVYEYAKNTTAPVSTEARFRDIENHRLSTEILKAYGLEILSGRSATEFAPDDDVTRQEAAKMLCNLIEKAQGSRVSTVPGRLTYYKDAYDISAWAEPYVAFAHDHNIMQGSGDLFNPKGNLTREQALLIIARLAKNYGWISTR